MAIIYLVLIALIIGLIFSFISFLLEHIFIVVVVVVLLGGLIVGILCIKEKFDDKKAAKQRGKRVNAVKAEVVKYISIENKEELPDDEEVLKELANQFKKSGNAAGQFAIAQKLYEKFDNGKMLIKCYFEGIGTEKDVQKGRNLQKEVIRKCMTMQNGKYALATWCSWYEADGFYVDLPAMLEVAREFCKNKNLLGVIFMEDVQLALVGNNSEEALANGTWRNRLGYEPYSLYHTKGKIIKENELQEEKNYNVYYDLNSYLIRSRCAFGLYGTLGEKMLPLYREFKAEVEKRLQNPERIENEARLRAEKIWEKVYQFEAARKAIQSGDQNVGVSMIEELSIEGDGYAMVWLLRHQARKGEPSAYFKLAEYHRKGAYLFSADKSENAQKQIAEALEKKGAEKNKTRAINGNAEAQYHYGLHLEKALYGIAAIPDISKAREYYRKAARQNHFRANGELLNMVDFGVTWEEAESCAKWIQENCSGCETFEKRSAMRSFWAFQIRRRLSDQWTILRKTKEEAPANNAEECFELAKKYIESEVMDGHISAEYRGVEQGTKRFQRNAARLHTGDWEAVFEFVYEYNFRIYKEIYRNYDVFEWDRNCYKEGYVKKALKKHRNPIYEYDLICGALTQYCVSLRWKAAQIGDLDAIADLCKLYNGRDQDRLRSGINVFSSALVKWCKAALNTNTGRGYYIAGYYLDQKVYLQKALEMGYTEAKKEIDDIEQLEQMKAESEYLFSNPYSSGRSESVSVRSGSDNSSVNGTSPMDELSANRSFKNMPNIIYDGANNVWKKVHAYDTTAVYQNDEMGEETITSCDISSKYASGYNRTFHWW